MMSSRYPHTSDPATLEAQRVAALAKSVAAAAVVCVIAGLATLPAGDARRTDDPRAGESVVLHAAADPVELTAAAAPPSGAVPSASDELPQALHADPDKVDDYQANVYY
jgi:hypothetical protein